MPEIPQFILERARANAGVFTADEVAEWPTGLLDQLVASGVLRADQPARAVTCDSCGDDHVEVVQYVESPLGTGLRAYIPCPQLGRVFVPTARLRRWSADMTTLAIEPATTPSTSVGTANQVPHALVVAHANLIGTLTQADDLYRRRLCFPNPRPVLDAIERFVHELELVPPWYAELQRRSSLVEVRCAPNSGYDQARHQALQSHSALPANLCSAKLALERLRNPSTQSPRYLQEVVDVRKSIENLLADETAGLSANAVAAFGSWRDECRTIQLDAERLHVDGCSYLLHVYQSAGPAPSERAQAARAILQTNMGGAHLHDLLLAAESIVAWIGERGVAAALPQTPAGDISAQDDLIVSPARSWPNPEQHTTAKVWMRKDGALCFSTKTDTVHDGRAEFSPTATGELTYQMRFVQLICYKHPTTTTLAEVIEQVYPEDFAEVRRNPGALEKLLRKVRTLVSDVRLKKFEKAGLNPDILPPLSVEASIDAGIGLRLAHLHRLDDKELDEADELPE